MKMLNSVIGIYFVASGVFCLGVAVGGIIIRWQ